MFNRYDTLQQNKCTSSRTKKELPKTRPSTLIMYKLDIVNKKKNTDRYATLTINN